MQTTESTAPQDQSGRQDAEAPTPEVEEAVRQRAEWARQAVPELATAGRVRKDAVLRHMAEALRAAGFSPTVRHRNLGSRAADAIEGGRH